MASNFCRNCGSRLTPGKSFCGHCGTMVIRPEPAPVQAQAPVAAPIPAAPASPAPAEPAAPVTAAPVAEPVPAEPATTVQEAPAVEAPAAEPVSPAMPQPMQTVVTYHPETSVTEQLPPEAVIPAPVVEVIPAEEPVEAPAAQEIASALVPAAPVVPAEPAEPVPEAIPAAPVQTAPAPSAPKKKSHAGLIIGLVCGGVVFLALLGVGFFFMFSDVISDMPGRSSGSGTFLDRIETMEEVSSGVGYTVYDKGFEKKIESARWWDYDGTLRNQGVYFANTKTLAFSVKVDEQTDEKLYYAYYYSKDNDFDKEDLKDPVCSSTITPTYYKDGSAYYNVECKKSVKTGYYCVVISKDSSFRKPYVVAYAKVLSEDYATR